MRYETHQRTTGPIQRLSGRQSAESTYIASISPPTSPPAQQTLPGPASQIRTSILDDVADGNRIFVDNMFGTSVQASELNIHRNTNKLK